MGRMYGSATTMNLPKFRTAPLLLAISVLCALVAPARRGQTQAPTRPYGIEKRTPWTTSRITGSPEPPHPYRIERVLPKLGFKNPLLITNAPGTERLFV